MPFRFANAGGRSALVADDQIFDLETLSGGALSADPMTALAAPQELHSLADSLAGATPTGSLADIELGPPVPRR